MLSKMISPYIFLKLFHIFCSKIEYSRGAGASLVVLVVKNPLVNAANIRNIGSITGWKIPWSKPQQTTPVFFLGAWQATVHRVTKNRLQPEATQHAHTQGAISIHVIVNIQPLSTNQYKFISMVIFSSRKLDNKICCSNCFPLGKFSICTAIQKKPCVSLYQHFTPNH